MKPSHTPRHECPTDRPPSPESVITSFMKILYWQVMLIRNNESNLILRLAEIQTNSVYSMNIGVELLRSH